MSKSKLDKLLDDGELFEGLLYHDTGIMIYDVDKPLTYLTMQYESEFNVYLYDDEKDILVNSRAKFLEDAKELAFEKMHQKLKRNYH